MFLCSYLDSNVMANNVKSYDLKTVEDVLKQMSVLVGGANIGFQGKSLDGSSVMPQTFLWRKYRREISVHASGYLLPKIMELRPNENPESMANRLMNYEPITTPHWCEAVTRIQRIISASSVDVQLSEKASSYVKDGNFDGLSLYDFFALNICEQTINNPNGLIVVYPLNIASAKGVNPLQFISDKEIIYFDGKTAVFASLLDSEYDINFDTKDSDSPDYISQSKTYNAEPKYSFTKEVYHIFTQNAFAVIQKSEDGENWTGTTYSTGIDFLPVIQLGGEKVTQFVYKSFFHNAIHYGNKALNRSSDDDAVQSMYAYPIVEMASEECGECSGLGYIKRERTGFGVSHEKEDCKVCKGNGEIIVRSPYKVMLRKRQKSNTDPLDSGLDSVKFYNPDIGILQHSAENWQTYLEMYKRCLYLIDRRQTASVESGSSIEKQYEPLYDFMHRIGLTLFANLEVILTALQKYIDPKAEKPNVTRPISYHLIEEGEAFNVLAEFLSGSTPLYLRRQYIKNFVAKYIGMSSPILKVIEAMEAIDPFFYYTLDEKIKIQATGAISNEQYILSIGGFGAMGQIMADPASKELTKDQISEKIKEAVKAWDIKPIIPPQ